MFLTFKSTYSFLLSIGSLMVMQATGLAAEFTYCFTLDLRLTELVRFNYCLYKIGILELVCVGCRHYKAPGVIGLMSFNDINGHTVCKTQCTKTECGVCFFRLIYVSTKVWVIPRYG